MASAKYRNGDNGSPEHSINQFAGQLIRRKARELASRSGFSSSDRDDIEQQLRMLAMRRLDKFDPSVAHYNAFVTTIVERYSATILEHRSAESRSHRRNGGSLNRVVDDGEGNKVEFGSTLSEDQPCVRTGVRFRSGEELAELAADVKTLLDGLPADVAAIFERLKHDTISVVARDLGMSRSTLCDLLRRYRSRFERDGMREYL